MDEQVSCKHEGPAFSPLQRGLVRGLAYLFCPASVVTARAAMANFLGQPANAVRLGGNMERPSNRSMRRMFIVASRLLV